MDIGKVIARAKVENKWETERKAKMEAEKKKKKTEGKRLRELGIQSNK